MSVSVEDVVGELVGLLCEGLDNPIGSILRLDFGPLALRPDDPPTARPHGWRHLTVFSPWRVQTDREIISDWNVDGGPSGLIESSLRHLVGRTVEAAVTRPPAWDLIVSFSGGIQLAVFGDCTDERDHAWFILGTEGIDVVAVPIVRPLEDLISAAPADPAPPRKTVGSPLRGRTITARSGGAAGGREWDPRTPERTSCSTSRIDTSAVTPKERAACPGWGRRPFLHNRGGSQK